MTKFPLLAAALVACSIASAPLAHATLVAPVDAATQMGNNGVQTAFYFRGGAQTFYGANLFPGEVRITGFSVRMMQGSSIIGDTGAQNFQIYVSTTGESATSLNTTTPALNHGADLTTVKDSPLSILAIGTLNGDGVTDWSTPISFDTPFIFNPGAGNLLMEFGGTMPNGTSFTNFVDGWEVPGSGLARVSPLNGGGFISDQLGVIVRFETEPVPEPSMLILMSLGAGSFALRRRR